MIWDSKDSHDCMRNLQLKIFGSELPPNPLTRLSSWIYFTGTQYSMHDLRRESIELNQQVKSIIINFLKRNFRIIPKKGRSLYLFGKYLGQNVQLIDNSYIESTFDMISSHFCKSIKKFSSGFGQGIGEIFLTLNDEELQENIFQLTNKDNALAYGFGKAISTSFASMNDKRLQYRILHEANRNDNLSEGLFSELRSIDSIREKQMWDIMLGIAKRNDDVAGSLAFEIGITLGYISDMDVLHNIFELARQDETFSDDLGDAVGQSMAEIEKEEIQEMILKFADENEDFSSSFYNQLGTTLPDLNDNIKRKILGKIKNNKQIASDLALAIGDNFSLLEQKDREVFLEMVRTDENFARQFGEGIGNKSTGIIQDQMRELASESSAFAEGLGRGIGSNFTLLESGSKDTPFEFAKMNPSFALGLGEGLKNWLEYNNLDAQDDLFEKIIVLVADSDQFLYGMADTIGQKYYDIKKKDIQQMILEKAKKDPKFGEQLFYGLGASFPTLDRTFQVEVFELAKLNSNFASGLGHGLEYKFENIKDKSIQDIILDFAENNPAFGQYFGIHLSSYLVDEAPIYLKKRILDIVYKNQNKGLSTNIGRGTADYFDSIEDEKISEAIVNVIQQNDDFGYGFAVMFGQSYLLNPGDEKREQVIKLLGRSQTFASGLGEGIGARLNISGIPKNKKSKEFLEECWKIAKGNDGFAIGLGKGVGNVHSWLTTRIQKELGNIAQERLGQNSKFFFGLGSGMGEGILFTSDSDDLEYALEQAKKNEEFAIGLGNGISDVFSSDIFKYADKSYKEKITKLAKESKAFASGLGDKFTLDD